MTTDTIANAYDIQAADYDRFIRSLVPDYDAFNGLIPDMVGTPDAALDVGCGTGNTAESLRRRHPRVRLTCVDPSAAMIGIARNRVRAPVTFVNAPIETYRPSGRFDAATSVMVMHNVQSPAGRRSVYRRIFDSLTPGGVYVSVDIVKGENPETHRTMMTQWRDFMLEGLSAEEVDGKWLPLHAQKDKPLTLSQQTQMLYEAGFRAVEVVHKRLNFALTVARRRD